MRVFAISDLHVDYVENRLWLNNLSKFEYKKDILILAGDVTHDISLLQKAFEILTNRFYKVMYVPGNHELWVHQDNGINSLEKYQLILSLTDNYGIGKSPLHIDDLSIVPLLGWYDYTFGQPLKETIAIWADYFKCRWPDGFDELAITRYFASLNEPHLETNNKCVVSFSHFLPRIDLMPFYISSRVRALYPVFGSCLIEKHIRRLGSKIHIYGHSHVNMEVLKDGIMYINNAYGYPYETHIAAKRLKCVYKT